MSNADHVSKLRAGVHTWNAWRADNPRVNPDLRGANLRGLRVCGGDKDADHYIAKIDKGYGVLEARRDGADLRDVNFSGADLTDAILSLCDLSGADLSETIMSRALIDSCIMQRTNLYWACMDESDANNTAFTECNLDRANLGSASLAAAEFTRCSFSETSFFQCDLSSVEFNDCRLANCDMAHARLVKTRFLGGHLLASSIYGVSVWDVQTTNMHVAELRITPDDQPAVTVDDLDLAQFLYLVLENKRLRGVIEGMTGQMVLILGRFTLDRKRVLDEMRSLLRQLGYVPVIFDFDKPASRDVTETVGLLAHMSRFVLADITDPRSIPQELQRIAPSLPSVPIQPMILNGSAVYSMFSDFGGYASFLPPVVYRSDDDLLAVLRAQIIPAIDARLVEIKRRRDEFEAAISRIER